MVLSNRLKAAGLLARVSLKRWASFQVRRTTRQHAVGLIMASLLLSSAAVVAQAPATPVGASSCGLLTGWHLTYHDNIAWHVVAVGYDNGGNPQTASIYTPNYTTYDGNHCWADSNVVRFYWYDVNWTYLSQTSKSLPRRCSITYPLGGCWTNSSSYAQVYGP